MVSTLLVAGLTHVHAEEAKQTAAIDLGGNPLDNFDIGWVDGKSGRYYLADRSNAAVDVIDTAKKSFLYRITGFAGTKKPGSIGGPNGLMVVADTQELYVGDGDSTLKIYDLTKSPPALVKTIPTGGKFRVDEMAYDPQHKVVIVANDSDKPAFDTFISADHDHAVLGKLEMPDASDGIEQPSYVPSIGKFIQSVPIYKEEKTGGIAVIDPVKRTLDKIIPLDQCEPAGSALGPNSDVLMGCKAGDSAPDLPAHSVIVDVAKEKAVATVEQIGGSDEVWYNPGNKMYFLAARDFTGGPMLGVINATTHAWVANATTYKNSHSVAADPTSNDVFVPLSAGASCKTGCVGVYEVH
ncbi:cytochrome C nitrite reductase [Methylovirgula sp. 4M-Z18]|nr:cytochrome C nitrite reductase [Methylovirgula sp. 4M-Z18]